MQCHKCDGQGVITKVQQLDGQGEDNILAGLFGVMTCGLSLLVTTKLREITCPRCGGTGETGRRLS
jgi:DnaJ-class molecular chaperone